MGALRLPRSADEFLQYFEAVNRDYPGSHWQNGMEMCRRWLVLQSMADVSQAEIDQFLARLAAEPNRGSGWYDLQLQFTAWARNRGFHV